MDSVEQQLKEQNAERFLPIYEELLGIQSGNEFNIYSNSTWRYSNVSMPNGGVVYYSNYNSTGVKVSEVYLNNYETNRIIVGNELSKNFADLVASTFIGWKNPRYGFAYSLFALMNANTISNVKNVGYARVFNSEDRDGSATVVLPWSDYSTVKVYTGGKYKRF